MMGFASKRPFLAPHPEERPKAASRRMAASSCRASILRDARKSALLRMRLEILYNSGSGAWETRLCRLEWSP
jgi:hypothetical protein